MRIREALVSDAEVLVGAEKVIAQTPGFLVSRPSELTLPAFQNKIKLLGQNTRGKYVVIENSDRIVGHAFLEPMELEAIKHIVRLTIAVHPGFEEQGFGSLLMTHLIDWARAQPLLEKIELNVRASNLRAIRLYQKLKFNVEGRIRNRVKFADGSYVDDLLMGLFLDDAPRSLSGDDCFMDASHTEPTRG